MFNFFKKYQSELMTTLAILFAICVMPWIFNIIVFSVFFGIAYAVAKTVYLILKWVIEEFEPTN